MSKTARGLVNFSLSQVGMPSVYGAKGEVVTQNFINRMANLYPSIYTSTYIVKAQNLIGQRAQDCSGLISRYTEIIRNSTDYKNTAIQSYSISQFDKADIGWAVWKKGHIGVCVGNGYVVEARSIDSGTIKVSRFANDWTHVIQLKDIEYSTAGLTKTIHFDIQKYQQWLNKNYTTTIRNNCGALLKEDNLYGEKTRNASLCVWKYQLNQLNLGYTFDLKNTNFGPQCIKYGNNAIVKTGKKGTFVFIAEGILGAKGFYTGQLDGIAGIKLDSAIRAFQKSRSLTVDGECGASTWKGLFNS